VPCHHRLLITLSLLLLCTAGAAEQRPDSAPSEIQLQIEQILDTSPAKIQGETILAPNLLREVYSAGAYEPLWVSDEKVDELSSLLRAAVDYGLHPQDYHLPLIEQLTAAADAASNPAVSAQLDVLLTEGLMLYSHHRRSGKVRASDLYPDFNFTREPFAREPPAEFVRRALDCNSLAAFIDATTPSTKYYELLRMQLQRYRELAAQGGWPAVPEGPALRKNGRDARVVLLRQRLQVTGELPATENDRAEEFDEALEQAVKTFQLLHGLDTDGVAGKQTLAAMNVTAAERVDQLRLSLERLRWVAQDVGDDFVAVNIAGFRLALVRQRKIVWTTRVVVGTSYRKTPVFRSNMTYLEFNPTWTIPPTILRQDTLPAIRKDPGYLAARNISVIDRAGRELDPAGIDWNAYGKKIPFALRQEPGPNNALGLVKFIFPNPYFVYMHDTPQRALFERPQRSFSSGCIRVEDPFTLVDLVLQGKKGFGKAELQDILTSGRTQRVLLDKPLPVLILYLTAAVDAAGRAMFYRDVYQRDAAVLRALDGPVTADDLPRY
jgi:murein L,D-transpeptidase YcbB/YkuD